MHILMTLEKEMSRVYVMSVVTFLSLASALASLKIESAPVHHIHCLHFVPLKLEELSIMIF